MSHHGLFRFIRIPFGLTNAPETFRRVTDVFLSQEKFQYALVQLDHVIVFSKSVEKHFNHVSTVLSLSKDAGVSLKLKKCSFFTDHVDFLGHIIRLGKLQVAETMTEAVHGLTEPSTITEMKSFLVIFNVFRRIVPQIQE